MNDKSIAAYDAAERVGRYDADMEIMHPNRSRMVDIALEFVPLSPGERFTALDLGCGSGFFTRRFLERFPLAGVIALDGAASMVRLAKSRLGDLAARVDFRTADFRELSAAVAEAGVPRLAFSSFALHHLDAREKAHVVRQVAGVLQAGGWFVNADLIVTPARETEERIQHIRVEGIVRRAAGRDRRFNDAASTRAFLDTLEREDGDKPLTVEEDLCILRENGFKDATVLWLEYREAVAVGRRDGA